MSEHDDLCERCGGDGSIMASEASECWGEDTFAEIDRPVACPDCQGIEATYADFDNNESEGPQ